MAQGSEVSPRTEGNLAPARRGRRALEARAPPYREGVRRPLHLRGPDGLPRGGAGPDRSSPGPSRRAEEEGRIRGEGAGAEGGEAAPNPVHRQREAPASQLAEP